GFSEEGESHSATSLILNSHASPTRCSVTRGSVPSHPRIGILGSLIKGLPDLWLRLNDETAFGHFFDLSKNILIYHYRYLRLTHELPQIQHSKLSIQN